MRLSASSGSRLARNLLPFLTAEENVALPMTIARSRSGPPRAERWSSSTLLGVAHRADHLPRQLAGGEQQRVAIAVALANSPRVLLADEPTGELDTHTAAEVFAALRQVNGELGVTIVIVTHDDQVSRRGSPHGRDPRRPHRRARCCVVWRPTSSASRRTSREEYALLDRAGRLQLPTEFVDALQLQRRVRLALEPDHVGVWPDAAAAASGTTGGAR